MTTQLQSQMTDQPLALQQRFRQVREASEALCAPLSAEDCAAQSMLYASPAKWHLAHTTWFFETFVLDPHATDYRIFNPNFRVMFNSYYNSIGAQHPRPQRGLITRPGLREVLDYRLYVNQRMETLLDRAPAPEIAALIDLGLHHEQQHQELILMDVKHLLSCNPLWPVYQRLETAGQTMDPPALDWLEYAGGLTEVGHDGEGFAFDNEGPRHTVYLDAFALASRPVSNGEFLAFIEDDGYRRPELWLSDAWDVLSMERWEAPLYWRQQGGQWQHFTLAGGQPLRPHDPVVHVSYYEADAYARWAEARLPREQEWERAAAEVEPYGNFLESGALAPCPARGEAAGRPRQLFGDVWEWTQSAYTAYPGYRAREGALGEYNGKFMCNQVVLRGGACVTPASHVRATYRNFFPPELRWQFGGLRLARDIDR